MDNDAIFVEARCEKTKQKFYIKHYLGADGVWVRVEGVKNISNEEAKSNSKASLNLSNTRISVNYKCPFCRNLSFTQCSCGEMCITCHDGKSETAKCAYCGGEGKVEGLIEKLDGSSGSGQ